MARSVLATFFGLSIVFGFEVFPGLVCSGVVCQAEDGAAAFAEPIVAKAEKILGDADLRRSGKKLQSTLTPQLSRNLTELTKNRRELKLQQKAYAEAEATLETIGQQIDGLNARDGELNLQLARIAGNDVAANNRLVALINATRSQIVIARQNRNKAREVIAAQRGDLDKAESEYAEKVFQTRKRFDELGKKIDTSLNNEKMKIALEVMNRNFDVDINTSANSVLRSLLSRLATLEDEIFEETIPLASRSNGSLYAMVSVNNQSIRMVVDSGATLITIPSNIADDLKIEIPIDAPHVPLALANGDRISGRRIRLQSVRVGQFEAKDVEAVILEPIARNAEPLLGLSYLDRYRFELNAAASTLKLLRVETE